MHKRERFPRAPQKEPSLNNPLEAKPCKLLTTSYTKHPALGNLHNHFPSICVSVQDFSNTQTLGGVVTPTYLIPPNALI